MSPNTHVVEHATRAAALEYIRQTLAAGNTLSKHLLESLSLDAGEVAVMSAVPLGARELSEFRSGHARPVNSEAQTFVSGGTAYTAHPVPNAKAQLADAISVAANPGDLCLLENSLSRAGDAWLAKAKSHILYHGSEVYHALLSADRGGPSPEDAIREAGSLPIFVGAEGPVPWPPDADPAARRTISKEELASFARTARLVFVGAYDGEGYLVWTRLPK